MGDMEFRSEDGRFGLRLPDGRLTELLERCRAARDEETGGIIIGFYTEELDWAVVTATSAPPQDSKSGGNWFYRGTRGLQRSLDQFWMQRHWYYLGEWHYHPQHAPLPSREDGDQMEEFARAPLLRCPEPLLIIIGGDPAGSWGIGAFVFPRDGVRRELKRVPTSSKLR